MSFLSINNLNKSFGKDIKVLKDINIEVEKGEFVVLLGPSGCGKSTLLNCIAGLIKYDSGDISINGKNVNQTHPSNRDIAMVFQSYALYPNMSVRENISFGMKIRKESKEVIAEKIKDAADILNITELLDRKPSELSGGQQQRVAIGRALVRSPQIFLFDEPLSNLDAKLRLVMRTEIKRLHKRLGVTIIYVTHDQVEAMSLADKIVVLDRGKVVQYGTPTQVYFEPKSTFVAGFIGSPAMNIIPCRLRGEGDNYTIVIPDQELGKDSVIALPKQMQSEEKLAQIRSYLGDGGDVLLGIRPENIHFSAKGKNHNVASNGEPSTIRLRVEFIEPIGADNIIVSVLNGKEVICRLHSDLEVPPPGDGEFEIDFDKVILYAPDTGERIC